MKYTRRPISGNTGLGDLFAWADRQRRDGMPYAARRLAKRYGLAPATATALADAFGLGGGQ